MRVLFGEGVPEAFQELPSAICRRAAGILDLLITFPRMFPVRRRGLMTGYRYFIVAGYPFYYAVASDEIRLSAIVPGRMRRA